MQYNSGQLQADYNGHGRRRIQWMNTDEAQCTQARSQARVSRPMWPSHCERTNVPGGSCVVSDAQTTDIKCGSKVVERKFSVRFCCSLRWVDPRPSALSGTKSTQLEGSTVRSLSPMRLVLL